MSAAGTQGKAPAVVSGRGQGEGDTDIMTQINSGFIYAPDRAKGVLTLTDCGCRAVVYADGSGVDIDWCPLHREAEELLKLLKEARRHVWSASRPGAAIAIDAAISRAERDR